MYYKLLNLLVFSYILSLPVRGQSVYTDSLQRFQQHYKEELSGIIKGDTASVKFFPIDQRYRVIAKVEKLPQSSFFPMATSGNISKDAIRYALLKFQINGKEYSLYAYQLVQLMTIEKYKNDIFVPFTDFTSGDETYAGGRYIDLRTTDISSNTILLDFNKAYNPYCAFRAGYNCPIPPKENDLKTEIKAGEKKFAKPSH